MGIFDKFKKRETKETTHKEKRYMSEYSEEEIMINGITQEGR